MSREKQIEEMAETMCIICRPYGHCPNRTPCTMANIEAEALYNAGYRKQSEGEWIDNDDMYRADMLNYRCSICGNYEYTRRNFCSECGAKMKGETK